MNKLQAICESEECAFKPAHYKQKKGKKEYVRTEMKYIGPIVKLVSRDAIDCPDCKSALFWMRV